MNLERFRWWHIDEILGIEEDLFGVEKWSPAMFWNELANGHYYRVALEGEEVVGYAGLAVSPPDEGWINNIAVRRDRQRHGVGRALLTDLLDEAGRRGVDQILLEVAVDNEAALKFYDSHGFDAVGIRRGYYQPSNTDALVMRRDGDGR